MKKLIFKFINETDYNETVNDLKEELENNPTLGIIKETDTSITVTINHLDVEDVR